MPAVNPSPWWRWYKIIFQKRKEGRVKKNVCVRNGKGSNPGPSMCGKRQQRHARVLVVKERRMKKKVCAKACLQGQRIELGTFHVLGERQQGHAMVLVVKEGRAKKIVCAKRRCRTKDRTGDLPCAR